MSVAPSCLTALQAKSNEDGGRRLFMNAIVIPDKFKGTISSRRAGEIIAEGIISVMPFCHVKRISAADGGDGTAEAYLDNAGGEWKTVTVEGPNGKKVQSGFALLSDGSAVIEMAKASGMVIADKDSNPLDTTTYGTGELIKAALDAGSRRLIIGIGGSATNDGGAGMAAALGVRFTDGEGALVKPCGGQLFRIKNIDITGLDSRIAQTEILVACDVENPLCGENGAAEVYARQKGADDEAVKILDKNLYIFAETIKRCMGTDVLWMPGGGAAGGLGAGLVAFLGAKLTDGAGLLLSVAGFEAAARDADFIVTGEGSFDKQSLFGKLPMAIAARSGGKPVAIVAGRLDMTAEEIKNAGFFSAEQASPTGLSFEEIKKRCESDLLSAAIRMATTARELFE